MATSRAKNLLKVKRYGGIALKLGPLTFINGLTWTKLRLGEVNLHIRWFEKWYDEPTYLELTIANGDYCFELDWHYYFRLPIWEWYRQETNTDVWRQKRWE